MKRSRFSEEQIIGILAVSTPNEINDGAPGRACAPSDPRSMVDRAKRAGVAGAAFLRTENLASVSWARAIRH